MFKQLNRFCGVALILFYGIAQGQAKVLYNGALQTLPTAQGWTFGGKGVQTATNGSVRLESLATTSDKAGYTDLGVGVLNRATGFHLDFRFRVLDETHKTTNRAGFSIIAISSDLRGIELGFWRDEIWAQADAPIFTHAEGVSTNLQTDFVDLDLFIQGDAYTLFHAGQPILTGPLRNYSSFGLPYVFPNFVFVGDDTSSAGAIVEISRIRLNPPPAITIPAQFNFVGFNLDRAPFEILPSGGIDELQASEDLSAWTTIRAATNQTQLIQWGDPDADLLPARFYRVRSSTLPEP